MQTQLQQQLLRASSCTITLAYFTLKCENNDDIHIQARINFSDYFSVFFYLHFRLTFRSLEYMAFLRKILCLKYSTYCNSNIHWPTWKAREKNYSWTRSPIHKLRICNFIDKKMELCQQNSAFISRIPFILFAGANLWVTLAQIS